MIILILPMIQPQIQEQSKNRIDNLKYKIYKIQKPLVAIQSIQVDSKNRLSFINR